MQDIEKIIENAFKKQCETTMKDAIRDEIQGTLKDTIRNEIQGTMNDAIDNKLQGSLKDTIRNEIQTTLEKSINPRFDRLEARMDKLEGRMENLENTVLVIEHEHGQKLDAIFDLVNLDKEVNKPKFDELSNLNKKTEKNYLHILNHEQRISTLEDSTT